MLERGVPISVQEGSLGCGVTTCQSDSVCVRQTLAHKYIHAHTCILVADRKDTDRVRQRG